MTVQEKIFCKLAENLKIDFEKIQIDAHLRNDLGADSLELMEFLLDLEEEFDVEISDKEASEIYSVKDCVNIISLKIESNQKQPADLEGLL